MNPITYLSEQREELIRTYRELHALAEPSWQEEKTSLYLSSMLEQAGLSVQRFPGHFGFIAEIAGETDQVVALRADMDALVQEVNGVIRPNHSCGHDAHSTMVLHAALAIFACKIRPRQTIRFIFQPAEEKAEGALQMIQDGVLENVTYLFGIHLRPWMEVSYGQASPVIIHGSNATVTGRIKGIQAHAARPQDGKNPIEAAAFLIHALQAIRLQTNVPYSVKMTQLQAGGTVSNVIPETATFTLDLRAQTNEAMTELQEKIKHVIDMTGGLTGTSIDWTVTEYVPAAAPNESAIKLAEKAIARILGAENVIPVCTSQGGEDFHFYTLHQPNIMATMIGLGCGLKPGLHHPDMTFEEEALVYGTKIITQAVLNAASL